LDTWLDLDTLISLDALGCSESQLTLKIKKRITKQQLERHRTSAAKVDPMLHQCHVSGRQLLFETSGPQPLRDQDQQSRRIQYETEELIRWAVVKI